MAEALNAAAYRLLAHARRARFTRDATRTMLANRFYVGELPLGKRGAAGWLKGAHEPLVPIELFERVQRQRARRIRQCRAASITRAVRVHALSGLIRCADCGEPIHLEGGGSTAGTGAK